MSAKASQAMFKDLISNISEYFPVRTKKNKWKEGGRKRKERERRKYIQGFKPSML